MDPPDLTTKEIDILQCVANWWKGNRFWMLGADILRLESADPVVFAEQQLQHDGAQFVIFAGKITTSDQIMLRLLRLI